MKRERAESTEVRAPVGDGAPEEAGESQLLCGTCAGPLPDPHLMTLLRRARENPDALTPEERAQLSDLVLQAIQELRELPEE
jgi:hypothetical protein